ncbi:hypothetical protein OSB04_004979 [Centaurea solstitialis]|uniref:Lon N-terminal domain-containing protein n=1 Tax=Centaurea solstitialis TaxID=347529 RepID=A0AA38WR65_9ASTR|nr:hypothetical protein OSB04_004979 [Centaurea solstitialis]
MTSTTSRQRVEKLNDTILEQLGAGPSFRFRTITDMKIMGKIGFSCQLSLSEIGLTTDSSHSTWFHKTTRFSRSKSSRFYMKKIWLSVFYSIRVGEEPDPSLFKKKKLFVHFVLDPIVVSSMSKEASFAAKYGCLVAIEKVEQLDVGALVSIRGIGRVTLVKFAKKHLGQVMNETGASIRDRHIYLSLVSMVLQVEPFLEGIVLPLQDNVPQNASKISSKVQELKEALHGLNSLEIKLKARKDEPLQTQTANSLEWALQEPFLDCEEAFIPSFAERVSFAALQNLSGSTQSEMTELQNEKLKAMDVKETLERVENCLSFIKNRVSMTAAKLAIQSLNMQ